MLFFSCAGACRGVLQALTVMLCPPLLILRLQHNPQYAKLKDGRGPELSECLCVQAGTKEGELESARWQQAVQKHGQHGLSNSQP